MINIGDLIAVMRIKDQMTPGIRKMEGALDQASGVATRAGGVMTAGFTLPLVAAAAASLTFATEINASMANVATLIPNATERVLELKGEVQDLAIETGKSTSDLSDGLFQVISAFGDTADTAAVLGVNARAAAAGLATTTDAINLTSAVTKGYNDTSLEAVQHVSDLAFITNKLGQTTFPELAASLGRVVPLSAELKVSQEELFGVMATATGVTGNASEVSTQLRGVLQSLLAPTADMGVLFEKLGVSSGKALIEQHGLQGAIELVTQAAEQTGEPLQKFIGSIEGQTLALALSGSQADTFTQKLAAMEDVAGATDEAFREQSQGVNAAGFAWSQLKQEMAVIAQEAGQTLLPVLAGVMGVVRDILPFVRKAVDFFADLPAPIQTAAIAGAALVAAIGPLLLAFGAVAGAVSALLPILSAIGIAIGAVATGPILLIGAALVGLAAIWFKWGDDIKRIVSETFTAVRAWMVGKFGAIVSAVKDKIDMVTGFFQDMKDKVVGNSIVPDMVDLIGQHIDRLDDVMVAPVERQTTEAAGFFGGLRDNVGGMLGDLGSRFLDFSAISESIMLGIFGPSGFIANLALQGMQKLTGLVWSGVQKIGSFFKNMFGGPSAEELAGREVVEAFERNLHQMLDDAQLLEAGNDSWRATVIAVRDAYLAAGKTEAEALEITALLWEAAKEGPEAVKAVIESIQPVLDAATLKAEETGLSIKKLAQDGAAVAEAFDQVGNAVSRIPNEVRGGVSFDLDDLNLPSGAALQFGHTGGLLRGAGEGALIAESGEFLMRRSAVDRLGVGTLSALNQGGAVAAGGGGNVTVQIMLPPDSFIENELGADRMARRVGEHIIRSLERERRL